MSFAWRILQSGVGNEAIEDCVLNGVKIDLQRYFPKSLISEYELPFENSECCKLNNPTSVVDSLLQIEPPIYDNDIVEVPISSNCPSPPTSPIQDEPSLEARKKYRKLLLRGKESKGFSRKNGNRRHSRIYREIFFQKMSRKFAIPKEGFEEVVDDIMESQFPDYAITREALVALQRESEMMITKMMCLASHLTNHASRETLLLKDFKLLKFLFEKNKEGCRYGL